MGAIRKFLLMGKGAPGILILIKCMRHHVPTHPSVRGFRGLRLGNRRMFGFFAAARYRERARRVDAYANAYRNPNAHANADCRANPYADLNPVSHRDADANANRRAAYAALRIRRIVPARFPPIPNRAGGRLHLRTG